MIENRPETYTVLMMSPRLQSLPGADPPRLLAGSTEGIGAGSGKCNMPVRLHPIRTLALGNSGHFDLPQRELAADLSDFNR